MTVGGEVSQALWVLGSAGCDCPRSNGPDPQWRKPGSFLERQGRGRPSWRFRETQAEAKRHRALAVGGHGFRSSSDLREVLQIPQATDFLDSFLFM